MGQMEDEGEDGVSYQAKGKIDDWWTYRLRAQTISQS